jgi:glyoxylate reductase
MARVFVTRALPFEALGRLRAAHDVDVWPDPDPPSPAELRERAAGADALLTMLTDRVDAELLDALPQLRAVANMAVGTDNIDLEAARDRGVAIGSTPGVLTDATADLAMALILAITRRLPEGEARVREGRWGPWQPAQDLGTELAGATLGIVGFGRIGRALATRAQAFGMQIVHTARSSGVTLDELLGRADVVSLHVPLSPATHHMIDTVALSRMKQSAYLVNTARGGVVDQDALRDALQRRRLAGAALDVTDPEPLPADDPLLDAPNLIVVPHIGSATAGTRARMAAMAVDNLLAALDDRPMPHPAG